MLYVGSFTVLQILYGRNISNVKKVAELWFWIIIVYSFRIPEKRDSQPISTNSNPTNQLLANFYRFSSPWAFKAKVFYFPSWSLVLDSPLPRKICNHTSHGGRNATILMDPVSWVKGVGIGWNWIWWDCRVRHWFGNRGEIRTGKRKAEWPPKKMAGQWCPSIISL